MGLPSPHVCDTTPWGCPRPWSLAQHHFHPCTVSYQTWLACPLTLWCGATSPPPPLTHAHHGAGLGCPSSLPAFLRSLRGNSIGVSGAKAMANALKVNRSLRRLK